jgi:hypothetical protein
MIICLTYIASMSDTIENALKQPKRVTTDAGTVEHQSVDDLIKADQYIKSKTKGKGLRITRLVPGGTND